VHLVGFIKINKMCSYIIQLYISEFICASSARSELTMNQVSVFFLCFVWFSFQALLGMMDIMDMKIKKQMFGECWIVFSVMSVV